MTEPIPEPEPVVSAASCWALDTSCCSGWDQYPPEVQSRAADLAAATLRSLTAYRVGGCPITVRPCRQPCATGFGPSFWSGGMFMPINMAGTWTNDTCGCTTECGCAPLEELRLPAPIGRVDTIKVDGQELPPEAWRVDNHSTIVRLDGQPWPNCQDLAADDTEVGTLSVTYLNAHEVDDAGKFAAGMLACEYAAACSGGACRLPSNVTNLSRAGVSMQIDPGSFPGGLTGLREVDAFISIWNPGHLQAAPSVWFPGKTRARVTTQSAT